MTHRKRFSEDKDNAVLSQYTVYINFIYRYRQTSQINRKKNTEARCSERWRNWTAHCTQRKPEMSGAFGLIVRPRSIYITPLTATSTNGHTTAGVLG